MVTRPNTYARTVDALGRLDCYARDLAPDGMYRDALAIRHLVEALDRVLRNQPGTAEFLEKYVDDACTAVGVSGP